MKKKIVGLFAIVLLVIVDLVSKQVITSQVPYLQSKPVIDGFFWLANVRNTGAAWSLFDGHLSILTLISFGASIALIIYFIKHQELSSFENVCFVLLIAGTVGNLYDRFVLNYVRDFLSFNLFGYMFPVFNFADSFLVLGVFGLLIYTLMKEKQDA